MLDQGRDPETVAQTLRDAGCPEEFIATYLRTMAEGTPAEQRHLLDCQRCRLLECVHAEQRKLDCLDYLRYQLQKETGKEERT